jgi:galactonate dehydratase
MDLIERVETFILSLPREVPYLGPLGPGEHINAKGYIVRRGNRSIYPTTDMSVLVKITTRDGRIGWGETYGLAAPQAVCAIIDDLLGPTLIGRNPCDAAVIWQDLYDLMRVRGFFGGYFVDSIAGVDIALWDLFGKIVNQPLYRLLGGQRHGRLPAYVSGLPKARLEERVDLAQEWVAKGFKGIKFAAAVSHEGVVREMRALRAAVGPEIDLMVDLHWKYTAPEAIRLIDQLTAEGLYFAEAPCAPEDIDGLAHVAASVRVPVAAGEEWRTIYEHRPRFQKACMSIIQPEMGHTGVTQFQAICHMAEAFHCRVIPHASIGIGLFMAASLHASSPLPNIPYHEYQHSIFDKNLPFVTGTMACAAGFYTVPEGPGLGIEPTEEVFQYVVTR